MVNFGAFLLVLAGLSVVEAHTLVYSLWVNDVDQGDGRSKYIRSPPDNNPVKDVSKTDIICNVANTPVPSSVSVVAGDKITFEWYHNSRGDDIISSSHKGPITVYITPASTNGAGAVWTKLAESGLSNGVWAVDTLIANKGKYSFTLPSGLAAGDYLLRGEVIALHEADTDWTTNHDRGTQFYPSCSQITVTSGGKNIPPGDYAFVGGYTPTGPGILYNLYGGLTTYPIPGPAVWDGTTSASGSPSSAAISRSVVAPTSYGVPTSTMAAVPATTAAPACPAQVVSHAESSTGVVAKYYQCGGKVYTGPTTCVSGTTCVQQNEYYFQCV